MSAEEPPAGPEGGRASPAGPSRPSEAAPEAHNPLFDDPEAAEGGEAPSSAVQETGPSGGSRAGGGGGDEQAGDDHSSAHSSAWPDSGAATAAEQLAALQLGSSTAEGGSSGAGHAGEAAAAIGGSPAGSDAELEEKASDEEEEDEEEDEPEESGTIKAHGGPASAPRLGASACGAGKARLSAQASSAASTASRASKRLTFSAPPKCLASLPRLAARANFSHSPQRVRQILRDNAALVKRLGAIAFKQPENELSQQQHDQFMANVAASSEARRAQEARAVMRSNLAIYKRLQEVKPSRDVARASLDRDFAKHERMMATLAALRRRSRAPSQPGAGGSRKGTQSCGGRRASASPSQRASVSAAAQQEAE